MQFKIYTIICNQQLYMLYFSNNDNIGCRRQQPYYGQTCLSIVIHSF